MQKILNINISIVGLGLIGGSYAMAFKQVNKGSIWGIDIDKATLEAAASKGIIDEGYSCLNSGIPLKKSDIVLVALYPDEAIKFIKENASNFKEGSIITDALGIKGKYIDEIQEVLEGYSVEFIGGHPMAGKESSGLKYASCDMFKGANFIITPTEKNKQETIDYMKGLMKNIGFKNISAITPEKHDEMIAVTSQLPHFIAVSLMNVKLVDSRIKAFVGGSFRDESRVANINPNLWCELFLGNKNNLLKSIDEFQNSISELKKAIQDGDEDRIKSIMKEAAHKKEEIG